MSNFSDAYIKRLNYLKNQPNKFEFDKDGNLLLIPNNEQDMKRLEGFLDKMRKTIREQIAQEILDNPSIQINPFNHEHKIGELCYPCVRQAQAIDDAAIARGTNDRN